MLIIVGLLDLPPAVCLVDGPLHGISHHVRVHDHMAFGVARGAAYRLDQGGLTPEEAFLVRVQDRHQGDLRDVQALSQEVDTHQHVELVEAHGPDDLGALQSVDVGVQVADPDPHLAHVFRQVLRHPFGEGGDHHLVVILRLFVDLADEIVDLPFHRPDHYLGIQKPGGADDLLGPEHLVLRLVLVRRRGDKEHLVDAGLELLKRQGPVVQGAGKAEAVLHQIHLPRQVPVEHAADLGDGDMALVHDDQVVLREIVHQGEGRFSRLLPGQKAGVVFNAGAESGLPHHLHVIMSPLADPLCFDQLVL